MSEYGSAEVEAYIQSLITALNNQTQRLEHARSDLKRSEQQWRRQAEQSVARAKEEAEKALKRERKGIEANADDLRTTALSVAQSALQQHAGTYLSAGWTDAVWNDLSAGRPGEWLRLGTVSIGSGTVPVALPLSAGTWSVINFNAEAFRTLAQNVIARVVAAFDPPRVRVVAYDPDLTLDLAAFAGLRAIARASVPAALTSEEDFEHALETIRTDIATTDDRLTAAGQSTYWAAHAIGHPLADTTPLRLLVIGSGTSYLSDRNITRLNQLRRLAADRGLLIIESATASPVADVHQTILTLNGDTATASSMPGISWTPDPWAGSRFIRTLCAQLTDRPRQSLAPTVNFKQIVDGIEDPWLPEADDGVEAVIGIVDGRDLVVRLRAEDPPMPNALVGGAVGQGKSNLLLVLIYSLAAKYSPAELEMVLVDLRDGIEFARLGPSADSPTWLPHVRALGLEFDPDYSLAVLRWVKAQMPLRSKELQGNGATKLNEYRQRTGKTMPRLLVVIDEFQRLFEGDDEQAAEAASLLEHIARTGRGFGIHIVLASQAITGIRGLATKSEAIFGQFHNRIVLKNTAAESQAFLAVHNSAAAELEYRGQAVFNDSLGAIDHNQIGTIAYARPDYLANLQIHLHQQGYGAPPSIFRATTFATWSPSATAAPQPSGIAAAVGMPITVEAQPRSATLTRSPNQALAVLGSTREIAIAVLARAVVTAADSLCASARVMILDGDSPSEEPVAWVTELAQTLTARGHTAEHVSRDHITASISKINKQRGITDLVVAIALDSVDISTPIEPAYLIPNELLREIVKTGPLSGTWTIGWWQSKTVLEEHLGYRAPGVRAWAFAGVSRDDLTDIAGHAVREPSGSPRFVWFDRMAATSAERLVPFAVDDILGDVSLV